jgi:hypothetical protein
MRLRGGPDVAELSSQSISKKVLEKTPIWAWIASAFAMAAAGGRGDTTKI